MITIHSTIEEIVEYLNSLRLKEYTFTDVAPVFLEECVDGAVFLNLQKGDLSALGLVQFGRRNTFFQHIVDLRGNTTVSPFEEALSVVSSHFPSTPNINSLRSPQPNVIHSVKSNKSIKSIGSNSGYSYFTEPTNSTNDSDENPIISPKRLSSTVPSAFSTPRSVSKRERTMIPERCYEKCTKMSKHIIKFPGIFHDIESDHKCQVIMSIPDILAFNRMAAEYRKMENGRGDRPDVRCSRLGHLQHFETQCTIQQVHRQTPHRFKGWNIMNRETPLHPLLVFTFNMRLGVIIKMSIMEIDGTVEKMDQKGIWLNSSLQMKFRQIHQDDPIGKMEGLEFATNQLPTNQIEETDHLQAIYKVHNMKPLDIPLDIGDKMKGALKLFVTNKMYKSPTKRDRRRSGNKPNVERKIYVQIWNVHREQYSPKRKHSRTSKKRKRQEMSPITPVIQTEDVDSTVSEERKQGETECDENDTQKTAIIDSNVASVTKVTTLDGAGEDPDTIAKSIDMERTIQPDFEEADSPPHKKQRVSAPDTPDVPDESSSPSLSLIL